MTGAQQLKRLAELVDDSLEKKSLRLFCFHPFVIAHIAGPYWESVCCLCKTRNEVFLFANRIGFPQWWMKVEAGHLGNEYSNAYNKIARESWDVLKMWIDCSRIIIPHEEDWLAEEAIPFVKLCHQAAAAAGERQPPEKAYKIFV